MTKTKAKKAEMQTRQALQVQGLGHGLGKSRVKQTQAGKKTKGPGKKSRLKSVIPVAKKREFEEVGYLHKNAVARMLLPAAAAAGSREAEMTGGDIPREFPNNGFPKDGAVQLYIHLIC